jgi:hypothetical protein
LENWRRGAKFPFELGPKKILGGPGNQCLRQVIAFLLGSVSSTKKTNRHDITEILLKMRLNTILFLNPIDEFEAD